MTTILIGLKNIATKVHFSSLLSCFLLLRFWFYLRQLTIHFRPLPSFNLPRTYFHISSSLLLVFFFFFVRFFNQRKLISWPFRNFQIGLRLVNTITAICYCRQMSLVVHQQKSYRTTINNRRHKTKTKKKWINVCTASDDGRLRHQLSTRWEAFYFSESNRITNDKLMTTEKITPSSTTHQVQTHKHIVSNESEKDRDKNM